MEQDNNRMVQESHRFRRRPLRTFVTVFSLALLAVLWEKDQGGREPETQQDGAGASSQPTDTRPEPADTSPKPHTGDEAALLGVALAGIVALYLGPGPWGWLSSAVGITLILILLAYDPNIRYRQRSQNRWALLKDHWKKHLAFSAVYALSGLVILGIFFDWGWPSKGFPEEPNIITQTGPVLGCRYYDTPDEVVPNIVQGQQIATEQNIQRGQLKC